MRPFSDILHEAIATHRYNGEPMTEAILANILHINRSSVHKWSKGAFFPSDQHMLTMSRIFGWDETHPVWLSIGKLPPKVMAFLTTTDAGHRCYEKVADIYQRYRALMPDPPS